MIWVKNDLMYFEIAEITYFEKGNFSYFQKAKIRFFKTNYFIKYLILFRKNYATFKDRIAKISYLKK